MRKGFTLIELIIVIMILSVLAITAFPAYSKYRKRSELAIDLTNCRSIYYAALTVKASGGSLSSGSPSSEIQSMFDRGIAPKPIRGAASYFVNIADDGSIIDVSNGGLGENHVSFPKLIN